MSVAKLLNLDTGEVESFEAKDGVLHIPWGRYAPTLFLDSQSSIATLREKKDVLADKGDTLTDSLYPEDQCAQLSKP